MERKLKRLQPGHNGFQFILEQKVREELSPIVFFDAGILNQNGNGMRFGMHPHSGIGIITNYAGADLVHDDTGENANVLPDGGLQWIQAGSGIWHAEEYRKKENTEDPWELTIHQLWLQLPPELEETEPEYQNLQPEDAVQVDNVKVVAGSYKGVSSKLNTPYSLTYLDVSLKAGETFEFETPLRQTRGFVFPRKGKVELGGNSVPLANIGILEENEGTIKIEALEDSLLILVTVEPQQYPIVTGGGSIHTNRDSLVRSQEKIQKIGREKAVF